MTNKKFILGLFNNKDRENVYIKVIKKGKRYKIGSSFSFTYSSYNFYNLKMFITKYFKIEDIDNGSFYAIEK